VPVSAEPRATKKGWFLGAGGLLLTCAWFVLGINWGVPSRRADAFLFGDPSSAWDGKKILELAGAWSEDPNRGADVDVNPVASRTEPVVLNATDAQRAEIVRRYRLFSYQPDEMITFRALSQMRPGERKLDPKLYQYGGLWIYPVGALLKVASHPWVNLVRVKSDLAYYLDHPDEFGRFYIVARLYSAAWGVVGVWAVYRLVRQIIPIGAPGCRVAPPAAAACFAAMPVVVNMAHEAKPHLPGAVLMLLAVLAASKFVQTGRRRYWVGAGALCGAAFGMVLSALPVFVILPLMALLRRPATWRDRIVVALTAGLIGVDVYFLTNPYVLLHLIGRDPVLRSNLGNSTAMYSAGGSAGAVLNAAGLIFEGTSFLLAAVGLVGVILLGVRAVRVRKEQTPKAVSRRATGILLAAPALLVGIQFVALAAGKPGEYGRFAILPDTFLAVEAVVALSTFVHRVAYRNAIFAILTLSTIIFGSLYVKGFVNDSRPATTRLRAAADLASLPPSTPVAVAAEPAPYSLPPVNLFTRRIVLLPRGTVVRQDSLSEPGVVVSPLDGPGGHWLDPGWWVAPRDAHGWTYDTLPSRISWADKRFLVQEVGPGSHLGE
jgi:hypothetical protein